MKSINIKDKFSKFDKNWHPHQIAVVDNMQVILAKLKGEIIVVPKGVEHNPFTKNDEEVHVLLFEKLSTAHTGKVKHEKTQTHYPKI
ncbi:cupin domain-containing protein [Algibacter sp.]|nr:cupin domain-containing protein [Algibacter sp.]MDC1226445.1 cupin domain-containing protein [Algibacter sp.]MDC1364955.1 cupin domain-containing protein [Algibacter sp.]